MLSGVAPKAKREINFLFCVTLWVTVRAGSFQPNSSMCMCVCVFHLYFHSWWGHCWRGMKDSRFVHINKLFYPSALLDSRAVWERPPTAKWRMAWMAQQAPVRVFCITRSYWENAESLNISSRTSDAGWYLLEFIFILYIRPGVGVALCVVIVLMLK